MAAGGGIAIGGANAWAALRANDPGHRADGAVVYRPKRRRARKKKTAPAATVDGGGRGREMQTTNVPRGTELTDGRQEKETPAARPRWGDEEADEYEEEEAEFVTVGGVCCRTVAPRATEEEEAEFIMVGGVRCRTVKAAVTGCITIAGANMWDFLCDNGPGHSADVVDGREHKKVAAAVVEAEAEETPPTASVAKKHETAPAAIVEVDDGSKVQADGAAEDKEAAVPDGEEVTDGREEKETAPVSIVDDGSKVQTDGAAENKHATVIVPDVEEVTDGHEEKETAAVSPSEEEEEATSKQEEEAAEQETSKEEEEEGFIDAVTTVARRTSTAAVAGGITVAGANMWAALRDDDPGHGAGRAKPARRGKKTKKNKKKRVAEDNKQADAMDDGVVQIGNGHEEQETPAELPSKVEVEEEEENSKQAAAVKDGVVEISSGHEEDETPAELPSKEEEEKTAGAGAVAAGGSRCPAVAGAICRAAIAAAVFALYCRFAPV